MALAGGLHAYLPQKDIDQKVNLTEQRQDAKKTNLIGPILFLYYEESLVSSNLNLKTNFFYCVRPNVLTYLSLKYLLVQSNVLSTLNSDS